jgi:16S rRNA (cytosine1402-N4)-methyltransferase
LGRQSEGGPGAGHIPVLAEEVVQWLNVKPDGTYLDATLGLGGHSLLIAQRLTTGRLIGLDQDEQALELARQRLGGFESKVELVQANFSEIAELGEARHWLTFDGLLADLGVSSLQLDSAVRGFSFRQAGPLDMRMDLQRGTRAEEIVNRTAERELADLLYRLGEEHDSRRIARAIVRARPIRDTEHLATVVAGARASRGRQRLHPATKTFLALRIAVNREMEALAQFLDRAPATLNSEGRLVVLSYHSLEDRMVKQSFRRWEQEGVLRVLTRKVIVPSDAEIEANPRARSAKMRVAERTAKAAA